MRFVETIDTHGHVNFSVFAERWRDVAKRARARGVQAIVMPGADWATSERAVALAREEPRFLFAAVGLHPTQIALQSAKSKFKNHISKNKEGFEVFDYESYLELAKKPEVVAIGEVGLDSYRIEKSQIPSTKSQILDILAAQEEVLKQFLKISQEVGKPLILHCRGQKKPGNRDQKTAMRDQIDPQERLIEILEAIPAASRPRFVVHCYQGTVAQAGRYLTLGGYISFTGTITYSNDDAVTEVVRTVPLKRLMIETDSPYLSPVPYRGEENEPWKVVEVARRVAELQEVSFEDVVRQTTVNAHVFFDLK